ncbi:MAG: response regulator [Paracoccaceae bacterium]
MAIAVKPSARPMPMARCLLVEDSEFDQKRIERTISGLGSIDLEIASTLRDARRMMTSRVYDLVLLDNQLPDGLGVNFASELRSFKGCAHTPVLMISDYPTPFMYHKASDARVNMVLAKDEFRPSHVRDALHFGRMKARHLLPERLSGTN